MAQITASWRKADAAQKAVQEALDFAALAAAKGDEVLAWLWLHSARRSAERLAEHLAMAADAIQPADRV